jgi:hypothetical protein
MNWQYMSRTVHSHHGYYSDRIPCRDRSWPSCHVCQTLCFSGEEWALLYCIFRRFSQQISVLIVHNKTSTGICCIRRFSLSLSLSLSLYIYIYIYIFIYWFDTSATGEQGLGELKTDEGRWGLRCDLKWICRENLRTQQMSVSCL